MRREMLRMTLWFLNCLYLVVWYTTKSCLSLWQKGFWCFLQRAAQRCCYGLLCRLLLAVNKWWRLFTSQDFAGCVRGAFQIAFPGCLQFHRDKKVKIFKKRTTASASITFIQNWYISYAEKSSFLVIEPDRVSFWRLPNFLPQLHNSNQRNSDYVTSLISLIIWSNSVPVCSAVIFLHWSEPLGFEARCAVVLVKNKRKQPAWFVANSVYEIPVQSVFPQTPCSS